MSCWLVGPTSGRDAHTDTWTEHQWNTPPNKLSEYVVLLYTIAAVSCLWLSSSLLHVLIPDFDPWFEEGLDKVCWVYSQQVSHLLCLSGDWNGCPLFPRALLHLNVPKVTYSCHYSENWQLFVFSESKHFHGVFSCLELFAIIQSLNRLFSLLEEVVSLHLPVQQQLVWTGRAGAITFTPCS